MRMIVGAWAGIVGAAVVTLAIDSSYESQTLAGGHRLHAGAIILFMLGAGAAGFFVGLIADAKR